MLATERRPAFYALGRGRAAEALTLLHPPYTLWHLSYVALGAGVAPHVYAGRLLWTLGAFGLAVGVGAHALDELRDRPLRTGFSDRALALAGVLALLGAVAIGVGGVVSVSVLLAPLVIAGAVFMPAYNLELAGGRLHNDLSFALGWGAFPAFTGYFANSLEIGAAGLLMAAGCMTLSFAQRRLSSAARELRRRTLSVDGTLTLIDGSSETLSLAGLLAPLDRALALLSLAIPLLAAGLLAARL